MTLAYRSLLNGCFSPSLSSHKAPNSAINATHSNRTSAFVTRSEEENQGDLVSNHSSEVKTAIMALMDIKMTKHATGCCNGEPVAHICLSFDIIKH